MSAQGTAHVAGPHQREVAAKVDIRRVVLYGGGPGQDAVAT